MLSPWQVYRGGIGVPSANAELVIEGGSATGAEVGVDGDDDEASRCPPSAPQPAMTERMASPAMTDAIRAGMPDGVDATRSVSRES